VATCRDSAYTEAMKFWTKFIACFLVAWLPLLGYSAQAGVCPEMTSSGMPRPVNVSPMMSTVSSVQKAPAHGAMTAPACHSPGSLSCGVPVLPTMHATLDIPSSSPVYRATVALLAEQFVPEPLQPPPRTL